MSVMFEIDANLTKFIKNMNLAISKNIDYLCQLK